MILPVILIPMLLTPLSMADLLANVQCEENQVGYIVPDPTFCNRYLDCDPVAGRTIHLCPPGLTLDLKLGTCQEEAKVDCSKRKHRQQQVKTGSLLVEKVLTRGRGGPSTTLIVPSIVTAELNNRPKLNLFGSRRLGSNRYLNLAKLRTISEPSTPLDDVECEGTDEYVVPDPTHCDRYLTCPEKEVELCKTGMVLDLNTGYCQREGLTDCKGREFIYREVEEELEAKLAAKIRKIEKETKEIIASTKVFKKAPEDKFSRLKVSRPGSIEQSNPNRPLVPGKQANKRKPSRATNSTHPARKTSPPPTP